MLEQESASGRGVMCGIAQSPDAISSGPDGAGHSRNERYAHIDALRGLAALAVLYLHVASVLLNMHLGNRFENMVFLVLTRFLDVGLVAVIVFFAISGFVIPMSLIKPDNSATKFAVSRFFRLYPAYWLSIGMALFFIYYLHSDHVSSLTLALNLTMLQQFFMLPNILGSYWTLQIELVFYGLCLALFLLGILNQNRRLFVISILLLLAAFVFALIRYETHSKIPVALPLGLSTMFWGSLLHSDRVEHKAEARRYANALTVLILAAVPPISLLAYNFDAGYHETWYLYTASYTTAIVIFYVLTGRYRISGRLFSWLGRISYSVYLFHPIFASITMDYIYPRVPALTVAHVYIVIAALITIAFAHICYVLVEAPSIRIGRALNGSLQGRFSNQHVT